MPVRVRPSWFVLSVDNSSNAPVPVKATGPKGRSGTGSVRVKVRDHGSVLDLLDVDAIGSADGASVHVEVRDLRPKDKRDDISPRDLETVRAFIAANHGADAEVREAFARIAARVRFGAVLFSATFQQ